MRIFINPENSDKIFYVPDNIKDFFIRKHYNKSNKITIRLYVPIGKIRGKSRNASVLKFVYDHEDFKDKKEFLDKIKKDTELLDWTLKEELQNCVFNLRNKYYSSDRDFIINIYDYTTPRGMLCLDYKIMAKEIKSNN